MVARLLVLLAAVVALPGQARAAETWLREAPLVPTVAPSTWTDGGEAAITLTPSGDVVAPQVADVYLIRVPPGLVVRRYLAPTNSWSSRTVLAYRHGVALPSTLRASWREDGPLGWSTVVIAFVRPGADSPQRANWIWRPLIFKVRSRVAPSAAWPTALPYLAPLALATAAAVALVIWPRASTLPEPVGRGSTSGRGCPER